MSSKLNQNKGFLSLIASSFLSAMNEGFIRIVFLFFTTYNLTQAKPLFMIWAIILYALSFCGATVYIGQLVDKYEKARVLRTVRLAEIGIMLMALVSLSIDSRLLLLVILMSMGVINACLRVVNNALIPQIVVLPKVNRANIVMKSATVFASGLSCLLLTVVLKFDVAYFIVCTFGFVMAVISYLITFNIPFTGQKDDDMRLMHNPFKIFTFVSDKLKYQFDMWTYLLGITWFWIVAAVVFSFSADYARTVLNARWSVVLFLYAGVFTLSYILGAYLYAKLSKKNNIGSYTSIVGILMSGFLLNLSFAGASLVGHTPDKALTVFELLSTNLNYWCIVIDIMALGVLSAFFVIPFYTLLQFHTPKEIRGRLFAFSNMLNAVGVITAFMIIAGLRLLFIDIFTILALIVVANVIISIYMVRLLPEVARRNIFKKIFKTLFKVEVNGLENLEKAGNRALIITNHMSYLDVLLISTFIDKRIAFSVSDQLIDKWVVKFMTNLVDVHPLDPKSPFAVKYMAQQLEQDKLCMILTEGVIDGGNTQMKIYEAPALMAVKGNAPILPIRIDGAGNTFFSRVLGKKRHFKAFPKITITIKEPVSFSFDELLTTRQLREESSSRLYDILSDLTFESYDKSKPIFETLGHSMQMAGRFKKVLEDTSWQPVKYYALFLKSFVLGALIKKAVNNEKYVGVMLPTSNACLFSVLGLHAYGKVPAMINFTSGAKQVIATCDTVGVGTIITAKKVVAMAKLEPLVQAITDSGKKVVYLEDLKPLLTLKDKLFGILGAFFPIFAYHKLTQDNQVKNTDEAVILFTSGSEAMPKAVFLSHKNILSNCYQIPSRLDIVPADVFLNCLPMFHSFGMSAGTFLPLLLGVKTVLYPTPLHYRIIPEVCASTKATVFFGTDTFLAGYAKCANAYDFNSLRIIAAGAEKVKDETRRVWSEKFGVRILEGYGATECSPFVSVNTFLHQRAESVGRIFSGMEYKLEEVPGITDGKRLFVKGPNVMLGYMRHENPLVMDALPQSGWYDTGDVVHIDSDGYIFIKGRVKRFAKIGGEMVSLLAVEMLIEKQWPGYINGTVSIPDARKGEQVVLITTCKDITKDKMISLFKSAGMSELGIPAKIIITDCPPLLGTGKFDYVSAKALAIQESEK